MSRSTSFSREHTTFAAEGPSPTHRKSQTLTSKELACLDKVKYDLKTGVIPSLRSRWQASLVADIDFSPSPSEWAQACAMRTRTPQGAMLMICLAFLAYERDASLGETMLPFVLHSTFFDHVEDAQTGKLTPRLRLSDITFINENLKGHPERIQAYMRANVGDSKGSALEIRLGCFCNDPYQYKQLLDKSPAGKAMNDKPVMKAAAMFTVSKRHATKTIERALSTVTMDSSAFNATFKSERHVPVLVSRCNWSEDPDEEPPIFIEMRMQSGRWFVHNWYPLLMNYTTP